MKDIEKKIDEILTRGVGEFIDPDGTFRKKLIEKALGKYNKDIVIKYGIDPTRPDIHLGHAVCFRKLREFQELGCKVIFLIGDFTALIGDPSGKNKVRPLIHIEEIKKNKDTYLEQMQEILLTDDDHFSWMVNSDWYTDISDVFSQESFFDENSLERNLKSVGDSSEILSFLSKEKNTISKAIAWEKSRRQLSVRKDNSVDNVSFRTFLSVLSKITFSRLIERDMFQKRLETNEPLFMHEMMYPVLQGIDSNVLAKIYKSCDLEVGGTDQTFNMLIGRDVMAMDPSLMIPQSVLSLKILSGTDGKEKMSKSLDNYIAITEEPNSMFLKVMSLPDTSIMNYFELCTNVPIEEIAKIAEEIITGENPRKFKIILAKEIIKLYHGEVEAENAARDYESMSKGENPENVSPSQGPPAPLAEFILTQGFAKSKSDARRKIEQGGVEIEGEKILDWQYEVSSKDNGKVMRVGKKDIVKIDF